MSDEEVEKWKDIPKYEGYYQVSNLGRVKSLERLSKRSCDKNPRRLKERIMKLNPNKDGYLCTRFSKNNIKRTVYVHRLVIESFIGKKCLEVNHIDGNVFNNKLSNLEYCTRSQNILHEKRTIRGNRRGVSLHKRIKKYGAAICLENKQVHLGYFKDKEDAFSIYYLVYSLIHGLEPFSEELLYE